VDVTSETASEQTAHVLKVLAEIGAQNTTQILAFNKADLLPEVDRLQDMGTLTHRILGETARQNATDAVLISAAAGLGIDSLLARIDERLMLDPVSRQRFRVPASDGRVLNLLHERAAVISQDYHDGFCDVLADAPLSIRNRLSEFAVSGDRGISPL
jgi:GTP-binding protein HflX